MSRYKLFHVFLDVPPLEDMTELITQVDKIREIRKYNTTNSSVNTGNKRDTTLNKVRFFILLDFNFVITSARSGGIHYCNCSIDVCVCVCMCVHETVCTE
jgi:hypothetical protein